MKITVVGGGYVGLVTMATFAHYGHTVTCFDIDEAKIAQLRRGEVPHYEPQLAQLLTGHFTTHVEEAYAACDVVVIAVGTPEKKDGSANLTALYRVVEQLSHYVAAETIVVIKSTVPVGTCDEVARRYPQLTIVSNPEFMAQGTAVQDTLYAPRIVIGVEEERARQTMAELYEPFQRPIVWVNRRSAEMIKYAANDFLALKISYMNEIANLCERVGADIEEVATGIGLDPRIGASFLRAGVGYGGSCFPKDTKALHWLASSHGYELKTVKAAIEVNEQQKFVLWQKAQPFVSSWSNKKVAVLGVTFKPNTDDLREAPALDTIALLLEEGADVHIWDAKGMERCARLFPTATYCDTIEAALQEAEVCFIFTEWDEVKQLPLTAYSRYMARPLVLDGRNCYTLAAVRQANITYISIGREAIYLLP